MQTLLTPEAARSLILGHIAVLEVEDISHEAALGRTLAQNIIAPFDLPPFDNSAMDGYAVRAADLQTIPTRLKLLEVVGAGERASQTVVSGQTIKS